MAKEQLLRRLKVVSGEGNLDGGAGLRAGGTDGEESRLGKAGAELLLRRGARGEAGEGAEEEGRAEAARDGGKLRRVHGSVSGSGPPVRATPREKAGGPTPAD